MLTTHTGLSFKLALAAFSLIVGLLGMAGHESAGRHTPFDLQQVVRGVGPMTPGSFRIVAQGDITRGHLVVYTVQRPGRGFGLGAILTGASPSASNTQWGGETDTLNPSTIRYGWIMDGGSRLLYGVVTASGVVAVQATTPDGGTEFVDLQPGGGFLVHVPADDTGASFQLLGPGQYATEIERAGRQVRPSCVARPCLPGGDPDARGGAKEGGRDEPCPLSAAEISRLLDALDAPVAQRAHRLRLSR